MAIGRRTVPGKAGFVAGLVWALLPATTWYGQNARPYAMATTLACAASYLLLRVLESTERKWLAWYAVSLAGLGAMNLFGLLLIPAHGIAFAAAAGWTVLKHKFPGRLLALAVPWLVTPLALLAAASLVKPVFEFRYVLISVPAVAL